MAREHIHFTEEQIENHFIVNPEWELIYKAKFGEVKPKEYIENFISLLLEKGYVLNEKPWSKSKNPASQFAGLRLLEVYYKTEDDPNWQEIGPYQHYDIYRTLLIWSICDYEMDLQTLM